MWKWLRWVLLMILISMISVCTYYWWVQIYKIQFSDSELRRAEDALATGITITDPQNDFIILESNDEKVNPEKVLSPYRLPQLDVKSIQMGADENYLYYKVSFYAKTDKKQLKVNGDKIHSFGVNFDLTEESGRVLAVLHTNTGWWPIAGVPINGTYYSTEPTGKIWPESERFAVEKNTDSKMYGGIGTDYQLGRFPLKTLGLKYGEKMVFDLEVEGGSDKYSHAAADPFLGESKSPALITWTIGSRTYSVNNNPQAFNADQK